jgi:hypothetical protein
MTSQRPVATIRSILMARVDYGVENDEALYDAVVPKDPP